nr:sialoglycoprotein [Rattus norvegicus]
MKTKIIIYICIWATAWAIPVPQLVPLERDIVEKSADVPFLAHPGTAAQNELHINNATNDDSPKGSELGRQVHSNGGYERDRNGSESIAVGGKSSPTQPILANAQGNSAKEREDVETYGHDGIHAGGENSTANGIRGQVGIAENAEEAKESKVHGQPHQDTKTGLASDTSQNGDATLVQENEPQVAGSKNSTNHEVGTHGSGVAAQETTPQREGEGSENQGAEVTPSIGEGAGLDNTEGSPSGNGIEEDEDTGSGDGVGADAGDGRESHDGTEGHEGQSSGGNNDNRGQGSVSTEDDDSKEQEGSPNGRGGDNTSSSEETGIEEGDGTQTTQDNQNLSPTEGGIISQAEACPSGQSQNQGLETEGSSTGNKSSITKESGKAQWK